LKTSEIKLYHFIAKAYGKKNTSPAEELVTIRKELTSQIEENTLLRNELAIARKELAFQKEEKGKRAAELGIANIELAFQDKEKGKRATELGIANVELAFQDEEKEKRAAELEIANIELLYQNDEKEKRAAELIIADIELDYQNKQKQKLEITTKELAIHNYSIKLASQYSRSLIEASLDPLVTINSEGKITDVNEAMVKATDKSREELIGTHFNQYFVETKKAEEVYKKVFKEGAIMNSSLTIIDGVLTDVILSGSVYKDIQGNVIGAVLVARDITEL
jgi:PAS domain S-box-containing protein